MTLALFLEKSYSRSMPRVKKELDIQNIHREIFTVYILRTSANTLYIGQTNNLNKRLQEHKSKTARSAKYMRSFDSFTLVYSEEYATRKEALQREWQLKQLTKKKKETLVAGNKKAIKSE